MITFTAKQSADIVARWNELANDDHQIDSCDAHLVIGDNFDSDIEDQGQHLVEVSGSASKSGNPQTFYIDETDVTIE